jgi:rhodanese-related sulfurtransferase
MEVVLRGGARMKRYLTTGLLVFALLVIGGCIQQQMTRSSYIDVTPAEAKDLIDNNPDLIIIDVSPAYADGHLPGAVNYYLGDGSLDKAIPTLDKNKMYLVYCHVDSVAIQGAQKLVDAGFKHVYRLEDNYSAWVDAGYPIEK